MTTSFSHINILAVFASAVIGVFGLGGIWYTVFGNIWNRESGISPENKKQGHPAVVYGTSLVMGLISAMAFAMFLGENPELMTAIHSGLIVGSCIVATSFAINYSFGGRSLKLFAIDAGYNILQFALYGIILGLWH